MFWEFFRNVNDSIKCESRKTLPTHYFFDNWGALKMGKYRYLTIEQRRALATMYEYHIPPKEISKALDVHLATVYRELKRGNVPGGYDPIAAQAATDRNIKRRGKTRKQPD